MIDEIALYLLIGFMTGFVVPCCYIMAKRIKNLENKISTLQQKFDQNAALLIADTKQLITEINTSAVNKQ